MIDMLRLIRMTFNLQLGRDLKFNGFSGYTSRGLFYKMFKMVNEDMAKEVHESKSLAPFSTTPVISNGRICFNRAPAGPASVSFTFLDGGLARNFIRLIGEGLRELNLMGDAVPLASVEVRSIEYKRLYREAKGLKSFRLAFLSPTYFRLTPRDAKRKYDEDTTSSPYRFLPLPDPVLLFRSLVRIWRKFSGMDIGLKDFVNWIEMGGVAIYDYPSGIRTYKAYDGQTGRWAVGFLGEVRYSMPDDTFDPEMAKVAHTLLKLGEYSNVGGNRTSGFGMVKYRVEEDENFTKDLKAN